MDAKTLSAEVREHRGKGPARQLRNRGLIPAVFYGPETETVAISCSPVELERLITGKYARNQLIELEVAGDKKLAVVKDLEVDPVRPGLQYRGKVVSAPANAPAFLAVDVGGLLTTPYPLAAAFPGEIAGPSLPPRRIESAVSSLNPPF